MPTGHPPWFEEAGYLDRGGTSEAPAATADAPLHEVIEGAARAAAAGVGGACGRSSRCALLLAVHRAMVSRVDVQVAILGKWWVDGYMCRWGG